MKLASCKSALNPRWFTLLTVLRRWSRCWSYPLLLCGLSYEAICFMSYLVLFCSCFFSPFSIAITSLGEESLSASVLFCVCSICECLVLLISSSTWCLGRAAVCDCGFPWTFLLPLFFMTQVVCYFYQTSVVNELVFIVVLFAVFLCSCYCN